MEDQEKPRKTLETMGSEEKKKWEKPYSVLLSRKS